MFEPTVRRRHRRGVLLRTLRGAAQHIPPCSAAVHRCGTEPGGLPRDEAA